MKNKRFLILLMSGLLAVSIFVGCTPTQPNNTDETKQPEETIEETMPEEMPTREFTEMTDDWQDMTFTFADKVYGFPLAYSELKETGWTFELGDYGNFDSYVLNPGDETSLIYLASPDYPDQSSNIITITLKNPTSSLQRIEDCVAYYFSANLDGYSQTFADKSPSLELAKGIKKGCTAEDIKKAYGEPTFSSTDGTCTYMQYEHITDNILVMNLTVHNELGLTDVVLEKYVPGNSLD